MSEPRASVAAGWRWEHSYADLPAHFHVSSQPTPMRDSRIVLFNPALAAELGLSAAELEHPEAAPIFTGTRLPEGAQPLAQGYAGHQFGGFTILGDGRAILLGEQIAPDGRRFDIQLKGQGPTRFSRRGDGRAALGPMLREYIISEAMHALGIPTTRSLAVATTGEMVQREIPLRGAVLTRVAASHIRVGTFQWAAARGTPEDLVALAEYTRRRHFPELDGAAQPHLAMLEAVIERQASLIAQWLHVGFVHGVMNTDNMALSGETIDYGPCAFLDVYEPTAVFSSIDERGRYAFGRQPFIAQWNLTRLAEAMLPLFHPDELKAAELAEAALNRFPERFEEHWRVGMRRKLGLFAEAPEDAEIFSDLLLAMKQAEADHTNTFAALCGGEGSVSAALPQTPEFQTWHARWQQRLEQQPQSAAESLALRRATNPAVIPRNHKVEEALEAAVEEDDLRPVRRLLEVLGQPFAHGAVPEEYRASPGPKWRGYRTYCGT